MSRQVVRFHELGGPEVLRIEEAAIPEPKSNEVRIRVEAIGLNRAEAMFRSGVFGAMPLPSTLGYEAAGTIDAVGADAGGFAIGDAVAVVPGLNMSEYGTYSDMIVYPARLVVKTPPSLTVAEAAASWMQYVTAYGALVDIARIAAGDAVVVTAASSSVGLAAIQIINAIGGVSIATTRTGEKAEILRRVGARHVIVTQEQDYAEQVRKITGGQGASVIFDAVAGDMIVSHAEAIRERGMVILYGELSAEPPTFPVLQAMAKGITYRGYSMAELIGDPDRKKAAETFILNGLETGTLKPLIDRRFAFKDIIDAHEYLESNQQIGKIIVEV